jgi:hypothetical protein
MACDRAWRFDRIGMNWNWMSEESHHLGDLIEC